MQFFMLNSKIKFNFLGLVKKKLEKKFRDVLSRETQIRCSLLTLLSELIHILFPKNIHSFSLFTIFEF
jgi:hypothetical protein